MRAASAALAASLALGCGSTVRDSDLFGGGQPGGGTGIPGSDSAGPAPTSSGRDDAPSPDPDGDGSSGDTADGTSIKLDVADPGGNVDDGVDLSGCSKADFLFVIDNSGSMDQEQQALISSFPGFIATIQGTLQAQDYHVMVVDTDASGGNGGTSTTCINGTCTCSPSPACCDQVCQLHDNCNGFPCDALPGDDCDGTIGAGKTFREDGTACLPESGPRFMDDTTMDLPGDFACVAEVGTFGSGSEVPMQAMLEAVSAPMNQAGACNDSFLRQDAILVVTFITDEEDEGKSPGDPPSWAQDLIAAKGGNEEAIVVLGLFGDHDQPGGVCTDFDEAEPAPRLRAFVESFGDRGFVGSVCAPSYDDFFDDSVEIIDLACDEFPAEG